MGAGQRAQFVEQRVAAGEIVLRLGVDQRVGQTPGQRLAHGVVVVTLDLRQFAETRPQSLLPPGRSISPKPQIVLPRSTGCPHRGSLSADVALIGDSLQVHRSIGRCLESLLC